MKKFSPVLSLVILLFSHFANAQAPNLLNYQAVVRNAQGSPLATGTNVSVRFQIHDQSASGTIVFTESTTAVTNQFGLITLAIGAVGDLSTVNWSTGAKYLQVLIDPTGGSNFSDMGTTQLLSVPYALFSGNSIGAIGPTGATGSTGPIGPGGNTGPQGPQGPGGNAGATGAQGSQGVQGPQGAPGITGPTGAQGAQGAAGTQGAQGPDGQTGPAGSNGATGLQGVTGATGNDGAQGIQGVTGATGNDGQQGIQGVTGTNGNDGAQGMQGVTGATGNDGQQGVQGITGATGNDGAQGIQGVTGATGNDGQQGIQGVTGTTGNDGAQGIQGVTGATGNDGQQGIQGITGDNGNDGAQGIQGVTGATGNDGGQGIQGITGATGNDGAQGIQGVTGATGNDGQQGIQGITGATGNDGAQGTQGVTGNDGQQGIQGVTGATGNDGQQGIQGVTGATGNDGAQGIQGVTGATGNDGQQGIQGVAGTTGNDGAQGIQGVTGATGNDGQQGIQGVTGATGLLSNGSAAGNTPYWNGSAWVNSANIYNDNANVGIGTNTPDATLQVNGTAEVTSLGVGTSNPQAAVQVVGGQTFVDRQGYGADPSYNFNNADLVIGDTHSPRYGYDSLSTGASIMIQSSGRSSIDALDRNDNNIGQISYYNGTWVVGDNAGYGNGIVEIPGLGGNGSKIIQTDNNGNLSATSLDPTTGSLVSNGTATGNTPYWNGSAWVNSANIYNDNANVGIGTNTPDATLQVNGTAEVTSLGVGTSNPQAAVQVVGGQTFVDRQGYGADPSYYFNNADLVIGDTHSPRYGYDSVSTGASIMIQSSGRSSIDALDRNDNNIGQISYYNGTWVVGDNAGYGNGIVEIPGLGGNGSKIIQTDNNGNLSATSLDPTTGSLVSNGTATGNTPYWNGSAWVNSANIYNDNANVGIGTNTPDATLQVNGTAEVTSLGVGTSNPQAAVQVVGGQTFVDRQGYGADPSYYFNNADLVIGDTHSPRYGYDSVSTGASIMIQSSGRSSIDALDRNDNNIGQISYYNGTWVIGDNAGYGNGIVEIPNLGGSGSRMVVADASGNLSTQAIGSGPTGAQGATGAIGATGAVGATGLAGATGATGAAGATGLLSSGSAAGNTPYWNGSAWVVNSSNIYNDGGNVGIGTTSPSVALDVETGNVSPAFKLVDGTQQNGYVLTSDTNGNASWKQGGLVLPFTDTLNAPNYMLNLVGTGNGTPFLGYFNGNASQGAASVAGISQVANAPGVVGVGPGGGTDLTFLPNLSNYNNTTYNTGTLGTDFGVVGVSDQTGIVAVGTGGNGTGFGVQGFGGYAGIYGNLITGSSGGGVLVNYVFAGQSAPFPNQAAGVWGNATADVNTSANGVGILYGAVGQSNANTNGDDANIGVYGEAANSVNGQVGVMGVLRNLGNNPNPSVFGPNAAIMGIDGSGGINYSTGGNYAGYFQGSIAIVDGTQQNGYVLTSDASGNASWQPLAAGSYIINGTSQQTGSNFNIDGNGTLGGSLTVAQTSFLGSSNPMYGAYATGNSAGIWAVNAANGDGPAITAYFGQKLNAYEGAGIVGAGSGDADYGSYSPGGIVYGVIGQSMQNNSNDGNIGVYGEAGSSPNQQVGVMGVLNATQTGGGNSSIQGPNAAIMAVDNSGIAGNYAGYFQGHVAIVDGSQSAGYVLTSDGSGNASWQAASGGGLANGSASGNTPYWNGSAWVVNSSNIYNDGGNVGIGTSTTAALLTVGDATTSSAAIATSNVTSLSAFTASNFSNYNGGVLQSTYPGGLIGQIFNIAASGANSGNWPSNIAFWTRNNGGTNATEKVRIDNAGNVGIGTTAPAVKLDVEGGSTSPAFKLVDGTQAAGRVLTSDANGNATWQAASGGGSTHSIGDYYGGGVVFWVDPSGQHGLICAISDQSTNALWFAGTPSNTVTNSFAYGTGTFTGAINTSVIISTNAALFPNVSTTYAARICNEYSVTVGGYTYGGWYLPSQYELQQMYNNMSTINTTSSANGGSNFATTNYWTSTEASSYNAQQINFSSGGVSGNAKNSNYHVRAVRAF